MRKPTMLLARVALAAFLAALLVAKEGAAQPAPAPKAAPKAAPKPAGKVDIGSAVQRLKSTDEGQIRSALDELRNGAANAAPAAPAVAEALGRGLTEALTTQAIDTLGEIESPEGTPVLVLYTQHRTVTLRRAAVKALTRTKGPLAAGALRKALGDADPQIRGTAALGLGSMKVKDAVPDLFIALDHKVNEAAASIGQLCNEAQCEQLAGKLGKLPFDIVTSGLEQVLARPAAEISDDGKIKVIGKIRELGTGEANRFLKDVQQRLPKDASPRIKQAVEQAVKATTGGSQ